MMCACTACRILFDRSAAGGGHYRLIPDRRLRLTIGLRRHDDRWVVTHEHHSFAIA